MNEHAVQAPALSRGAMIQDDCAKVYKPSRMECLRDYPINIRFLSIGCVIEVGCKSIPFSSVDEGMSELNNYIQDPYTVRQLWEKKFQEEV